MFDLHLVDPKAVTVITLDVHLLRRSAKIKVRGMIEMLAEPEITPQDPFQEETIDVNELNLPVENDSILLNDPMGQMLDIDIT